MSEDDSSRRCNSTRRRCSYIPLRLMLGNIGLCKLYFSTTKDGKNDLKLRYGRYECTSPRQPEDPQLERRDRRRDVDLRDLNIVKEPRLRLTNYLHDGTKAHAHNLAFRKVFALMPDNTAKMATVAIALLEAVYQFDKMHMARRAHVQGSHFSSEEGGAREVKKVGVDQGLPMDFLVDRDIHFENPGYYNITTRAGYV
ncbi:hypothetical protein BJX65DRAFT_313211 [Aspergillus insuetus]